MPIHQSGGRMIHSPSAWRGAGLARPVGSPLGPRGSRWALLRRMWKEVREHPAETAALVAMTVALSRLLRRPASARRSGTPVKRRLRDVLPLGVMAALCILGLSA
jgi:hypothetical protein